MVKENMDVISKKDIKNLSALAQVDIDKEKLPEIQRQISQVLDHLKKLEEINTDNIDPIGNPSGISNVFRDDVIEQSLEIEDVISNSNNIYNNLFKVKATINKE